MTVLFWRNIGRNIFLMTHSNTDTMTLGHTYANTFCVAPYYIGTYQN